MFGDYDVGSDGGTGVKKELVNFRVSGSRIRDETCVELRDGTESVQCETFLTNFS